MSRVRVAGITLGTTTPSMRVNLTRDILSGYESSYPE